MGARAFIWLWASIPDRDRAAESARGTGQGRGEALLSGFLPLPVRFLPEAQPRSAEQKEPDRFLLPAAAQPLP